MKLIFLDIDGVLNSVNSDIVNEDSSSPSGLSKDAIHLVKYVCDHTNAKIVISSSWQVYGTHEWFCGLFEAYGWKQPPILDVSGEKHSHRGENVKHNLTTWTGITDYVCIDDETDFYDDQPLVKVDSVIGFTIKNAIKCIEILGNDYPEKQERLDGITNYLKE